MSVVGQSGEFGEEQEYYVEVPRQESPEGIGSEPTGGGSSGGETPGSIADVEKILADLYVYISGARVASMSSALRIDREYVLGLIQNARTLLPVALRSARWLIKEREEYLARAQRDADAVIEQASAEAARMVDRTQVVQQAKRRSQEILDEAADAARRQRHEADDYCDRQFERCEDVTRRALEGLVESRRRLQGETERIPQGDAGEDSEADVKTQGFFDQDQ